MAHKTAGGRRVLGSIFLDYMVRKKKTEKVTEIVKLFSVVLKKKIGFRRESNYMGTGSYK